MDSVTYNKLEYITSGSGLTQTELGEIVDLMDEYVKEHVTEALRKHGIMQAEGSDEMCGSDCCPNDGACEHCQNPIRKSAQGAAVASEGEEKSVSVAKYCLCNEGRCWGPTFDNLCKGLP